MDWRKLERKELPVLYQPPISGPEDVSLFDRRFAELSVSYESPTHTPINGNIFQDFSYQGKMSKNFFLKFQKKYPKIQKKNQKKKIQKKIKKIFKKFKKNFKKFKKFSNKKIPKNISKIFQRIFKKNSKKKKISKKFQKKISINSNLFKEQNTSYFLQNQSLSNMLTYSIPSSKMKRAKNGIYLLEQPMIIKIRLPQTARQPMGEK